MDCAITNFTSALDHYTNVLFKGPEFHRHLIILPKDTNGYLGLHIGLYLDCTWGFLYYDWEHLIVGYLGPLLLTWVNFNPGMDKK